MPDYVNDLPEGYDPDTPRCQYFFKSLDAYKREEVFDRSCGLPVADDPIGEKEVCYFHSERPRSGDEELPGKLEAAVARGAYLGEARLSEALLWCAELQRANLGRAELEEANLFCAKLQGADLRGAKLEGAILFGAKLQGADLRGAKLNDADLRRAIIAPIQEIDTETNLATVRLTDLGNADLRGALLSRITIAPEIDLSSAKLDCPICDEDCARHEARWAEVRELHYRGDREQPTFPQCEAVYRQLKLNFQESGDYQKAGEFFLREMECKRAWMVQDRKQAPPFWGRWGAVLLLLPLLVGVLLHKFAAPPLASPWWLLVAAAFLPVAIWAWPMRQRAVWRAMYLVCGYGEQPGWIAGWIAGLVVFFAFSHGWAGIIDVGTGKPRFGGWGWPFSEQSWPALWEGFQAWLTSLYFSVITFTSLGYADLAPGPGWGKAFAGLEAALGIVLMSLLLVVIVRKWSR